MQKKIFFLLTFFSASLFAVENNQTGEKTNNSFFTQIEQEEGNANELNTSKSQNSLNEQSNTKKQLDENMFFAPVALEENQNSQNITSQKSDNLESIYKLALEKDAVFLQAKAQKNSAMQRISTSRAILLPQINLSFDYLNTLSEINDQTQTSTVWSTNLAFSQSLYNRNSWITSSIAEKNAHLFDINYNIALQNLILRTNNSYFSVLESIDNLDFISAERAAIKRQLEQTKQRFEVGLTAITDVHEAQAEYDLSIANEILAKNSLDSSYESLRILTGSSHKNLEVLNTDSFKPAKPYPNSSISWHDIAKDKNLNIAYAQVNSTIAKQNIALANSNHLPDVELFANQSINEQDNVQLDSSITNFGIRLNLPIYSGGGVSSSAKEARFNFVNSQEVFNQTSREVYREVIDAYNAVVASVSAVEAYEQTLISRRSALEATTSGFEVGSRTIVDVLDSTRQLFDAKRQLSNARYAYVLNVLNLKFAAGTLSENDVLQINSTLINKENLIQEEDDLALTF